MRRWTHLIHWPEKLAKMSADELRSELAYWKMRARICTRTQEQEPFRRKRLLPWAPG